MMPVYGKYAEWVPRGAKEKGGAGPMEKAHVSDDPPTDMWLRRFEGAAPLKVVLFS